MKEKCVIIVSESYSSGEKANAAAILGAFLGQNRPDLIGPDSIAKSGETLKGIITIPVPVLQTSAVRILELAAHTDYIFTDTAQHSRTYDEYLIRQKEQDMRPIGILLIGPEKKIRKLTGDLPLMKN